MTKDRFTTQVSGDTVERVRNAVYGVQGLTLTELTETALRREVAKLERKYNEGEPFPQRAGSLPVGRRVEARV